MIQIPVSTGELIDKITILQIKSERIKDLDKKQNVVRELNELTKIMHLLNLDESIIMPQMKKLKEINEKLWVIEDDIRELETQLKFGPEFIDLARSVYKSNDIRAKIKKEINQLTGSELVEEKSYAGMY